MTFKKRYARSANWDSVRKMVNNNAVPLTEENYKLYSHIMSPKTSFKLRLLTKIETFLRKHSNYGVLKEIDITLFGTLCDIFLDYFENCIKKEQARLFYK